ncbi:MAG: hypothetical protein HC913_12530 [Microscillaceae bacterium]|nr:hypothetical protein [Microscillaceae bacterium]
MKNYGLQLVASSMWLLGSGAAFGYLAWAHHRRDFIIFLGLNLVLFGAYFSFLYWRKNPSAYFVLGLGLLSRLVFWPSLPVLSDDCFRFIWDGQLLLHGFNPFLYLPSEWRAQPAMPIPALGEALYHRLNSPHYFTVYPPLHLGLSALGTGLFPESWLGAVNVMRSGIVLADVGIFGLLVRLARQGALGASLAHRGVWMGAVYFLNPVVVMEGVGNAHFEPIMLFFMLAGLYYTIFRRRASFGALLFALAIATKLLPLMLLPLVMRGLGLRKSLFFGGTLALSFGLMFWPFLSMAFLQNLGRSLNLYFQHFEFNASVYYLLRALGTAWYGYNPIAMLGPGLKIATLLAILGLSFASKNTQRSLWLRPWQIFGLYYLLATTVHPWYLIPLIGLSFGHPLPLWWSAWVGLSYGAYQYSPYHEHLAWVSLEYSALAIGGLFWLWLEKKERLPGKTKNDSSEGLKTAEKQPTDRA